MKIAATVHQKLLAAKKTLSIAESCTGGALAAALVAHAGASAYFLGGIVAYSYASKSSLLGVSKQLLKRCGAVSRETVAAMATGVLHSFKSDYALAVSGIAGPEGGLPNKPVGLVCVAIAQKRKPVQTFVLYLKGSRKQIIHAAVRQILQRFNALI